MSRKYNSLPAFAIAVSMMAFIPLGCAKEDPTPSVPPTEQTDGKQDNEGQDRLSFSLENAYPDTRTSLSEVSTGVFDLVWSENDKIAVVGATTAQFTLSDGADTSQGTFTGSLPETGSKPYLYAVYPYADGGVIDGDVLKFNVPQSTSTVAYDNITKGCLPGVGCISTSGGDAGVGLHNVFGLLKLTLSSATSVKMKRMTLHDLAGNMLWGTCSVPIKNDGTLDYENATLSGGTNSVSLTCGSYVAIKSTPRSFYFPVPAGALDGGFSIVIYEQDTSAPGEIGRAYTFIQKISNTTAVGRSKIAVVDPAAITEKSEPLAVNERGFYKSLYIDAGVNLSTYYKAATFPFIGDMGLGNDYEYFAAKDENSTQINAQNECFGATTVGGLGWSDQNGQLLYPDGEPRFRMIYVNGGQSTDHGKTFTKKSLDNVNKFYKNGGSYVGTCAGSFLAATFSGTNGTTRRYGNPDPNDDYSFGIWPGSLISTSIPVTIRAVTVDEVNYPGWGTVCTGMKVVSDKIGDYGFAPGDTLQDTWHHGGSYMPKTSTNLSYDPEILMTYQYADPTKKQSRPSNYLYTAENLADDNFPQPFYAYNSSGIKKHSKNLVDSVSTFAYKESSTTGRAVLCGSHPERRPSGSKQLPYMKMMVKYAMDGFGDPTVKGVLAMGSTRNMNKSTNDDDPSYTKIGDRQYHHFTFTTSQPTEEFVLQLSSGYDAASGVNLYLALRKDGFAWLSDADYVLCNKGGNKTFTIKNLPAGTWYVSVYCATTVTAVTTTVDTYPCYFRYSGHTEVLDGIAYTLALCPPEGGTQAGVIADYGGVDLGTESLDL